MRLEDFPTPNPDFERLKRALMREEEPDRIPFFEIQIDPEIMTAILGEPVPAMLDIDPDHIRDKLKKDIKLMHGLGYDYVTVWNMPILPGNFIFADDTAELSRGERPWQSENDGPIASREDLENFMWPNLSGKKYSRFEFATEHMPEGMKILAVLPGVFETVRGLMGVTGLCYKLADDPALVGDLFERVGSITLEAVENLSAIESVGAVCLADDEWPQVLADSSKRPAARKAAARSTSTSALFGLACAALTSRSTAVSCSERWAWIAPIRCKAPGWPG